MNALDEFSELKKIRKNITALQWSGEVTFRLFTKDYRDSSERKLSAKEQSIFATAMNVTEHGGGSEISYCARDAIGTAACNVMLRYIDKRMNKLAVEAKEEAKAVLAQLEKP